MPKLILVVEDDIKSMILVRDLLEMRGHEVVVASDGRRGVAMARERRPDLILMDIQMPIMDGIAATLELKGDPDTAAIEIVAVTASVMAADEERVKSAGFDAVITKPIDVPSFLKTVDSHLAGDGSGAEAESRG